MNSVRRLNNNIKYINFWGGQHLHETTTLNISCASFRHDEITEALKGMEKKPRMWKKEV